MKNIFCTLLAVVLSSMGAVLTPVSAHASVPADLAEARASSVAITLGQMRRPNDLLFLERAHPADRKALEIEIEKLKNQNVELPRISSPTPTTVACEFSAATVTLDFSRVRDGVIRVQNQPIHLASYKTLLNFKNEVAMILDAPTKASLMTIVVEPVHALTLKEIKEWMSYHLATVVHSEVELTNKSSDPYLAQTLIDAYLAHSRDSQSEAQADPYDGWMYSPAIFSCKGGHLKSMNFSTYEVHAKKVQIQNQSKQSGFRARLERSAAGEFLLKGLDEKHPDSAVALNAKLQAKSGADYSSRGPFYHFPEVAERCCGQSDCATRVARAYQADTRAAVKNQIWDQHNESGQ